jgi:O-methyltransferase involved in polyketide biosynthesis
MDGKALPVLEGVSETLLITLYTRPRESSRPDALMRDEKAVEIVRKLGLDFTNFKLQGHDEVALMMRVRHFDRTTAEFLISRHPGCQGACFEVAGGLSRSGTCL